MATEPAECGKLAEYLEVLGNALDRFLTFQHPDAMHEPARWRAVLERRLPISGIGIDAVMEEMTRYLVPNGSAIPNPGSTAFITTGATTIGALATLAGAVASPQRLTLNAFNFLEEQSLEWLAELFRLPPAMKGLYSSGGSVANLAALGAARQQAFEARGIDPARQGVPGPARLYASNASHHSIRRAAAVLGLGREAVVTIATDTQGRMIPAALERQLQEDRVRGLVPVAVVANAGTTTTGAIDPLHTIGTLAHRYDTWFHVDGAYGLPGILDPTVRHLYAGLELADSVIVDPHKWLGAPVGIGATFVRDRALLQRAFTQEAADYLEQSCTQETALHSMDSLGIPYSDFGVELSAPPRGAVVWALLREIGADGLRARICRHNAMARQVAEWANAHPNLEVLQWPTLSICCFRYVVVGCPDLDALNTRIHRALVRHGRNIPSTAQVNGQLAIRPCFIGARTGPDQAQALVDEVLALGAQLTQGAEPDTDTNTDTNNSGSMPYFTR
ncbi:aminotransferase class V-fold PLP-dependent enzyme [Halomonas sp. M4R5S39]|uniref:pyridoxal phosphate-dependent decarboxylase family protein n=1 Tax=Halomonas kalidii TaxID=3043293 RepID=UPI0024A825F7|nr:aminotransferase class V-fold PLP-dependent enzyme [Halomonas kalidii]MDI5985778.1 aminotransferase class V-fold PLP-dependent enzyme [Halomonas kalidii]